MSQGTGSRTSTILIALVGTLALCALPAAASAKLKTRSKTVVVPAGGSGTPVSATATCPRGTRAVGGGFATADPNNDRATLVFESRRIGQRKWRASGIETDPSGTDDALTSYVNCRHLRRKVTTEIGTASVPDVSSAPPYQYTATATCPPGRKAIAGGFAVSPWVSGGPIVVVNGNRRTRADRWSVTSYNFDVTPPSSGTATAYVYCRAAKAPAVRSTIDVIDTPFGTPRTITTPRCPGAKQPGAGGFEAPVVPGSPASVPFIFESRRSVKRWRTSAEQILGTTGPFSVFAYCS